MCLTHGQFCCQYRPNILALFTGLNARFCLVVKRMYSVIATKLFAYSTEKDEQSSDSRLCSFLTGRMARLLLKLHTNSTLGNTSRLCSGLSLWHRLAIDTPVQYSIPVIRVTGVYVLPFIAVSSMKCRLECEHSVDFNSDVLCQHTGINFLETGHILSFRKPSSLSILSEQFLQTTWFFSVFYEFNPPDEHSLQFIKCRAKGQNTNNVSVYSSPFVFSPIMHTKPAGWLAKIHSPLVNLCN